MIIEDRDFIVFISYTPCKRPENENVLDMDDITFFPGKLKIVLCTGCPKKHGNSVTNSISSLLLISIVIP